MESRWISAGLIAAALITAPSFLLEHDSIQPGTTTAGKAARREKTPPRATFKKTAEVSRAMRAPQPETLSRPDAQAAPLSPEEQTSRFLQMPLDFEINSGQAPAEYAFVAHGPSYALGISSSGLALSLHHPETGRPEADGDGRGMLKSGVKLAESTASSNLRLNLVGAAEDSEVSGLDPQSGRSSYFIGSDPAKWRADVAHFNRVKVAGAYPGVDLVFYGNRRHLEYDFVVAPGADPKRIRLQAVGANSVTLDAAGNAIVSTAAGDVELKRPVAYQEIAGVRQPVESGFRLGDGRAIEFEVGSYDHSRTLTIDPVLEFAVAIGGGNGNFGTSLALDSTGNLYFAGGTCSGDFPTTAGNFGQYPSTPSMFSTNNCYASFVVKMDPTGSTLLYSDFIGGTNGSSGATQLAIDSSGDVYLAGVTSATDFPTLSNIGPSGPTDCGLASKNELCLVGYVLKLNPAGSQLMFSSLLGGNQSTLAYRVKLNPVSGDVDVLGETNSTNFLPTATTLETSFGGGTCNGGEPCFNGFLLGLDPSTGALRYGTFIGGAGNDWAADLAFDASGNIYVAGSTQLPLASALGTVTQTYAPAGGATAAGASLYAAKLDLSGTKLTPGYLTLIEGDADTGPTEIAIDGSGYLYFTGASSAQHLAVTSGVYQATNKTDTSNCAWGTMMTPFLPSACGTAIVGKLAPSGALSFLTYLGGSAQEMGESIAVDSNGNLWIGGVTSSADFPFASDQYSFPLPGLSPFLAEMSNNGTQLLDATLIGGSMGQVSEVRVDSSNNVYVLGYASAAPSTPGTYPTNPDVYDPTFVQKWSAGTPPSITVSTTGLVFPVTAVGAASPPQTITLENTGTAAAQLGVQLSPGYSASPISDFLESTTCGATLAANSSCSINVSFAPGPAPASCVFPDCYGTNRQAEIAITDNAIEGDQTVMLQGTSATGPGFSITPNPIVFPAQEAGTTSAQLYVSGGSTGDAPVVVSNIALSGPNASEFQLTTTGTGGLACLNGSVYPGTFCSLDIAFSPAANATGTRTATLTFTDNAGDSPQTVPVTGTVAGASALNISPLTLAPTFPVAIGTSTYSVLAFQNPSASTVQVTSLAISGTNAGDFSVMSVSCSTAGSLPMTIAAAATCYADITFDPAAGASGLRTATLTVGTTPTISGLPTVALQGDAVTNSQPAMSFFEVPNPMNFGALQVGQTSNNASVLFTINNNIPIPCAGGGFTCGAPLIISAITPGLSDYALVADEGSTNCVAFPVTIPAGGDCVIAVTFTPAQAGARNTTLTIQSNDPQGTVQLPVYGTGLSLPLGVFLETALNFGNSAIGVASPPMTATLQNTGESALNLSAVTASANFNVSANTCTGPLAPQATCTISVTFTPPTAASYTGMLTIADNDALGGQQVVNLNGTGATGPQLRITPQTISFQNQTLDTLSAAQAVTLTSTGDSTVTFPANPISTTQDFVLQSTTCASSLPQGSSCTANVQFHPTSAALENFPESGTMLVSDNATGSPQPVFMQGTGVQGGSTASTTMLTSSLNPSTSGQAVTFTATVTGPSGNMTVPTGSVTFLDGGTTVGTGTLNASGVATLSTSTLSAGSHSITAVYGGDSNFAGSTSSLVTQVVNAQAKPATATTVTSSANPSGAGQLVIFTAFVTGPSGNTTEPTGSVSFLDGTTTLGSGMLNGSGVAEYSTSALASGSHSITAVYSGDANFSGSTSLTLTQVVSAATLLATSTTVSSSLNPSGQGQAVTFTATVAGPTGNTTLPTGTVTFMDGTTSLGTAALNGSAQATYNTSSLSTGSHSITAAYGGNASFAGSTSSVLMQTVGTPGFTVSFNPASVTVNPGQTATTTITVTPQSGFNQQVSFACSGLPAASTCNFSPASVTPNGSSAATSTLTIATDVAMVPLHAPSLFERRGRVESEGLLAVILLGLGGLVRSRSRWRRLFLATVLIAVLGLAVSACGGGGGSSSSGGSGGGSGGSSPTTPAGTSTITVVVSAGSVTQNATFTLTVE